MAGMIEPRCLIIPIYRVLRRARDEPDPSSTAVIGRGVHAPQSRERHCAGARSGRAEGQGERRERRSRNGPADHLRLTDRIAILCAGATAQAVSGYPGHELAAFRDNFHIMKLFEANGDTEENGALAVRVQSHETRGSDCEGLSREGTDSSRSAY